MTTPKPTRERLLRSLMFLDHVMRDFHSEYDTFWAQVEQAVLDPGKGADIGDLIEQVAARRVQVLTMATVIDTLRSERLSHGDESP